MDDGSNKWIWTESVDKVKKIGRTMLMQMSNLVKIKGGKWI